MKKLFIIILVLLMAIVLTALELERDDNRAALQTCTRFAVTSITIAADSTWQAVAVPDGAVFGHFNSDDWFAIDPDSTTVNPAYSMTYVPVLAYAIDTDSLYAYADSLTVIKVRWDKIR